MRKPQRIFLFIAILWMPIFHLSAQNLSRKMDFGATGYPVPNGEGIEVAEIYTGHTADLMGLLPGDIIKKFGGIEVPHMGALLYWLDKKKIGDQIMLIIERDGKRELLKGIVEPKPYEKGEGIVYDAFSYKGGKIRSIINRPVNVDEKVPAILYVQDYTCASVDYAGRDYEIIPRMAKSFANEGIAFIRVEKPGAGDSRTQIKCHELGYKDEGKMYEEAMRYVRGLDFVDKDKITVLSDGYGGNQVVNVIKGGHPCGIILWGFYTKFTSEECRPLRHESYWKESEDAQKDKNWGKIKSRVLFIHGENDDIDNDGKEAMEMNHFLSAQKIASDYQIWPRYNHYFMNVPSKQDNSQMFIGDFLNKEFFRKHFDEEIVIDLKKWMEACWVGD